jgi:hypothetical protein
MVLKIVTIGLPRPVAEEMIHRLASEGRFYWDLDFKQKLDVREFTMRQVIEALKSGAINQGPIKDEYGDWRCRIKRRVAGRLVRVVAAINEESFLILISVY